ncbi:MAG TPA: hypothetical protein VK628_07910 [Flavitalea sp.]|nr:hypothetical protein [Flavitalea sp.]
MRLLIVLLLAIPFEGTCQIISALSHELFRDKILISYNINGLAVNQRLEVGVYCSVDNFKAPLASVSGNGVGEEVAGNGQKVIIWDVLKDRPSLVGKISFELRALVQAHAKQVSASLSEETTVAKTEEEKKSATYAEMSSALGAFIIDVKDLVSAFQHMTEEVYEDNLRLRKMTDAIIKYNNSFNRLNNGRMLVEKQVNMYWKNEALYNDVRYLFDYALGELHSANVLELNNSLNLINDINQGKIQGRKNEKDAKERVLISVNQNTNQLEKRIQELERRANRILYTLSDR